MGSVNPAYFLRAIPGLIENLHKKLLFVLVYVHCFFTHVFHKRLSFLSNYAAEPQCINFINEILVSLLQKVQREAWTVASPWWLAVMEASQGRWTTGKLLESSPLETCCCFLLSHLRNGQGHKVKEAIALLWLLQRVKWSLGSSTNIYTDITLRKASPFLLENYISKREKILQVPRGK